MTKYDNFYFQILAKHTYGMTQYVTINIQFSMKMTVITAQVGKMNRV